MEACGKVAASVIENCTLQNNALKNNVLKNAKETAVRFVFSLDVGLIVGSLFVNASSTEGPRMIRVIYLETDDDFIVPFSKSDFTLVSMGEYYVLAAKGPF